MPQTNTLKALMHRIDFGTNLNPRTRTQSYHNRPDWETSYETGAARGSRRVFTCSCDRLDFNGVSAGVAAPLLQLHGQLLQVGHASLIGRDQTLEFTGETGTQVTTLNHQFFLSLKDKVLWIQQIKLCAKKCFGCGWNINGKIRAVFER